MKMAITNRLGSVGAVLSLLAGVLVSRRLVSLGSADRMTAQAGAAVTTPLGTIPDGHADPEGANEADDDDPSRLSFRSRWL